MNCPSRTDDNGLHPNWNQNPNALNADSTTLADLNGIANLRESRDDPLDTKQATGNDGIAGTGVEDPATHSLNTELGPQCCVQRNATSPKTESIHSEGPVMSPAIQNGKIARIVKKVKRVAFRYVQFVGPGMLISVAYIDPGNYATDVGAGAATRFSLLFIVLLSNLFAIFLQALCIKLGSVTGKNLAESCRENLPKWLTVILYILSESAIIATDIAEVIGSAIALNLLLHIPLVAGCAITIVDVLIILLFYKPSGSMTHIRIFEYGVMSLVIGVTVCFCIQLSYIQNASIGEVFRGYLPSSAVVGGNGIYLSCGILGATVMPHSLFLGSELCQPRLRQFEVNEGIVTSYVDQEDNIYRPSVASIRSCLKYSIFELAISLFTFALFVNSAILIVAGSSLYNNPAAPSADLFGIYHLLSNTLASAAGTIFALALLLSGTSAGIVCTMAGQIVSDGFLNWTLKPWVRRLVTRGISITPSIIIAGAVGKEGLDRALVASQVVLSVILPIVATPLIWFTCRRNIMTVTTERRTSIATDTDGTGSMTYQDINMQNGWIVTTFAVVIWIVLVIMNVALLVLLGLGKS